MSVLTDPQKIVKESFSIINSYLKDATFTASQKNVVRRIIHATSDLRYAKDLLFHREAIKAAVKAIREGKNIIVDANMVKAGINKVGSAAFGCKIICLIDKKDVMQSSDKFHISRAMVGIRKAARFMDGALVVIGNAPTALFELCDLIKAGKASPALVIGLPVGFVGAKESKKKLCTLKVPYITNRTRKGGSSAACAAINSLLILAKGGDRQEKKCLN